MSILRSLSYTREKLTSWKQVYCQPVCSKIVSSLCQQHSFATSHIRVTSCYKSAVSLLQVAFSSVILRVIVFVCADLMWKHANRGATAGRGGGGGCDTTQSLKMILGQILPSVGLYVGQIFRLRSWAQLLLVTTPFCRARRTHSPPPLNTYSQVAPLHVKEVHVSVYAVNSMLSI